MQAAAIYQKTDQVIPILWGDKNPSVIAKIAKTQYVKIAVIVSFTFVDIENQLSK
ncbi:hypothetical protein LDI01_11120 [Lentilactobacillus diolivorans]|uniref:Uncharacterized protein n=1 Tax=Lentilactobacillus diolivorans TaxID=179838 RepID=A0ABQ0XCX9_9LACO|nr:hypothetical protein LDI01_11120 [Lentilactobacillus diolivorans]